jgi:hypothetical protein
VSYFTLSKIMSELFFMVTGFATCFLDRPQEMQPYTIYQCTVNVYQPCVTAYVQSS